MKAIYKIIAAFSVIIITITLTDLAFGKVADYITRNKGLTKQNYLMSCHDKYEIIFVGSSRAHRHYDTPFINDSLGIKTFNAGDDGRGLTYQCPELKAYLNRNTPKLVVLDLSPALDGKWNERISMLYPLANIFNEISDIAEKVEANNKFYLKSSLFRYNSNLITELSGLRHPFSAESTYGYNPVPVRLVPEEIFKQDKPRSYSHQIDSIEYNILIDLIKLCKNKRVNLVGVFSPIYGNIERSHDIDSIFEAYNIPLIDNITFRLPLKPNKYFNDATHLNEIGAREYTKHVIYQISDSLHLLN